MDIIYRHAGKEAEWLHLGCYQLQALIDRHQEGALTCYLARIAPHSRTPTSYHGEAEEIYYVLSGHGQAILNGQPYELSPGVFIRLPPKTHHAFVTGSEPLELLDIHSPGSWPDRDLFFVDMPPGEEKPQERDPGC